MEAGLIDTDEGEKGEEIGNVDDADSRVSMENTNQNDCWQVRVRDLRELIRQTGSQTEQKYVYR